ncbi:MAG: tetratricopeptide repeat domain protein [Bacillales bacterium]|nr:tetratricopeptide repeat domain protein [Bacillales bacterium]
MSELGLQEQNFNDEIVETNSNLCSACGEFPKDIYDNPNSRLCTVCRDRYTKLAIPKWVIAFILIMFAFTLAMIPSVIPNFKTSVKADREMKNKEYALAYKDYYTLLKKYGESKELAMNSFEAAFKAQKFNEATDILNNRLIDKEFSDTDYQKVSYYADQLNMYYETFDECEFIIKTPENYTTKIQFLENLLKDEKYSKSVIYSYLSIASTEDPNYELKYLKLACEQKEPYTFQFAEYGNGLRRTGNLEQAMVVLNDALKKNATDATAIRGIGIIQMLKGHPKNGLKTIQKAYDLDPNGFYMSDTLIIALSENNQNEKALKFMKEKQDEGIEFDQTLLDYLDGKVTLENYYINL